MKPRPMLFLMMAWSGGMVFSVDSTHAGDAEAKLLEGKWRVVSAKDNGSDYAKDKVEKMLVTIANDEIRLVVEGTGSEQAAKFVIDPKKDPKHIDFIKQTRDIEWEKGLLWKKLFTCFKKGDKGLVPTDGNAEGIYKLEGDALTLCWRTTKATDLLEPRVSKEPAVRPGVFQSVFYRHQFLFVLKRAGAGK